MLRQCGYGVLTVVSWYCCFDGVAATVWFDYGMFVLWPGFA